MWNFCCEYLARKMGLSPNSQEVRFEALGLVGKFNSRRKDANRRKAVRAILRGAAVELPTFTNGFGQVRVELAPNRMFGVRGWDERGVLRELQTQKGAGAQRAGDGIEGEIPALPGLNIKVAGKVFRHQGMVVIRRAFLRRDIEAVLHGEPIPEIPHWFLEPTFKG